MTFESTALLERCLSPDLFKFGPERLSLLASYAKQLDCLAWQIPVITVTGTNGKGSTVKALQNIYEAAGYRAGVYTSPHLLSYHERISINSEVITEHDLIACIQTVDNVIGQSTSISFFERLTLIALYYFKQQQVDVLILEVGLGGRLDAVNIIDADVVIVTTVDLDHEDYLGNTIDAIALEKAGLFRSGKQAIYADNNCPISMRQYAETIGTQLHFQGTDYQYEHQENQCLIELGNQSILLVGQPKIRHQALVAAIYATHLLQELLPVLPTHWQIAVEQSFVPARVQLIQDIPMIILDVSHNLQGVKYLSSEVEKLAKGIQIHAVFSMMKDKNAEQCVAEFNKLSPIWYNCVLESDRSHTEASIQDLFETNNIAYEFFANPEQAFLEARIRAAQDDLIVVFGSFLMVQPILKLLLKEGKNVLGN